MPVNRMTAGAATAGRIPSPRERQDCPGKMRPAGLLRILQPQCVMPGLVPGIHAVQGPQSWEITCSGPAWMAGTSPAMTALDCRNERKPLFACRSGFPDSPALAGRGAGDEPSIRMR
jgi:hypothetical protein